MQTRTENQIFVKVIDFGIAVQDFEHPDIPLGHPAYWAPECFIEPPKSWGNKIDLWALAMVALKLLFKWPLPPASQDCGPESPFAEGWRGALKAHYDKKEKAYLDNNPNVSACFFKILSYMFHSDPEARVSALKACEDLRKGYKPGYFLSLGAGDDIPVIVEPVLPAGPQSDDDSIFRFRKLDVDGFPKPLVIWAGCYLVRMHQVMKAKYGKKVAGEVETSEILRRFEHACWRFKVTNRFPEKYITIELALEICKGEDNTRALVAVLQKQQARREKAIATGATPKGKKGKKPAKEGPGMSQLSLVESISTSDSIIAITEEGRMLLVRASDGYIHVPSLHAARAKRLLLPENALDDEYVPLEEAMLWPDVMSHNDIVSLGAATYSSY